MKMITTFVGIVLTAIGRLRAVLQSIYGGCGAVFYETERVEKANQKERERREAHARLRAKLRGKL